jgi:hypothetical protein
MHRRLLHVIRLSAGLFVLADGLVLAFVLLWLIGSGGYVTCGKRVLDDPSWPLVIGVWVGPLAGLLVGGVALIVVCSKRLASG